MEIHGVLSNRGNKQIEISNLGDKSMKSDASALYL